MTIKVLLGIKFNENLKNWFEKQDFPKVWLKCLEIARLQDFALITTGIVGTLSGPRPPATRCATRDASRRTPPLVIPAYGPDTHNMFRKISIEFLFQGIILTKSLEWLIFIPPPARSGEGVYRNHSVCQSVSVGLSVCLCRFVSGP